MAIFVLSDLHLSTDLSQNKSMEVFGDRWQDYMTKIKKNWNAVVGENDTVVVPGDISWATRLEESKSDLCFLNSLNGKKLLGKGNHDFWWATANKMTTFFAERGFSSLQILYNNAYRLDNCIVCGTRGWFNDEKQQSTAFPTDYAKIVNREVQRLELSLTAAEALQDSGAPLPILVFLHFPPVWGGFICREIIDLLHAHHIKKCYFGHIHGVPLTMPRSQNFEGIDMILTAADFLRFAPMPIFPDMD